MDDNGTDGVENASQPTRGMSGMEHERESVPWGAILLGIWALALVIFSVQNAEIATIDFLWFSADMPVALLVIVTALLTALLTGVGFSFYRRRRRKEALQAREPESDV